MRHNRYTACLIFGSVAVISFYTPLFSTVGLWVLNKLPVPQVEHASQQVNRHQIQINDPALNLEAENASTSLNLKFNHQPTAYVVLGGGLTEADANSDSVNSSEKQQNNHPPSTSEPSSEGHQGDPKSANNTELVSATTSLHLPSMNNIVLNQYTLKRMQTVLKYQHIKPLPIVLTGVDAPWMQDWLLQQGIKNIVTENASMNTCENARFTAKRLHLRDVYLITDAYHMTRARRQFALNGIHTLPIPSELPMKKGWLSPKNNAQHSRRTLYELAAYTRDVFAPQDNCRQASEVSFETLLRSRKPENLKTF